MSSNSGNIHVIGEWYQVQEIRPDIYWIKEPGHVSFFVLKSGREAVFIDSGLGLSKNLTKKLLQFLEIDTFSVYLTHAHCDHMGLNYLASEVFLSQIEWEKYQRVNDENQIAAYYKTLEHEKKWPREVDLPLLTQSWKPAAYLKDGDVRHHGRWTLEAISLPGHTNGHLCFLEKTTNALFCGDLVYTGAIYLHLPDSSLCHYRASLEKVESKIAGLRESVIFPAHNEIPLPTGYLKAVLQLTRDIASLKIEPRGEWAANDIFKQGIIFERDGIRIVVKKEEWDGITKTRSRK